MTESPPESQRYPADVVAALPIPSSAKDFLTSEGLPAESEFFQPADKPEVTAAGHVRIGTDYGTDICLDSNGHVRSISVAGEYPERFVNSDISSFVESLALVTTSREELAGLVDEVSDEELDEEVEELAAALVDIDGAVFSDPENWWSVIFEQMRDGLL